MTTRFRSTLLGISCTLLVFGAAFRQAPALRGQRAPAQVSADWRDEWSVEEGFALTIDSEGFSLPTAIVFVPEPGSGPKDPLYFVTEIRGVVKVVTNDRSVETFAQDFFQLVPQRELPEMEGQVGLAGICLDPARGYVFVTFAEQDANGALRNNIVRFESTPRTFSSRPIGQLAFRDVFAGEASQKSHQIGGCQVSGDHLYVGVGDALQTERSQDTTSVLGKVLRLTVDGEPVRSNPFYRSATDPAAARGAANYVWAYGLRNPFGLKIVDEQVFVAENGDNIDRFVRVEAGENYLWNGRDFSIGARADLVISPAVAPVQLEYAPHGETNPLPPEHGGNFFMALSAERRPGIMRFPYSFEERRVLAPPQFMLRYQGGGMQIVSGVALGPDGLYVVPILPDASGRTAVYRLHYAPGQAHPTSIADMPDPEVLLDAKGCLGCHTIGREGGTAGPRLDRDSLRQRLAERLAPRLYRPIVATVDGITAEPYVSWRDERAAVLAASGSQQQWLWTTYKILEPRFDNPASGMPNPGVTLEEAQAIARFLLGPDGTAGPTRPGVVARARAFLRARVPHPLRARHLALFAVLGFVAGVGVSWTTARLLRRRS